MADLDNLSADMDAANLYTEEIVTDRKMGTIHVLTPITPEGARPDLYRRSADHDADGTASDLF